MELITNPQPVLDLIRQPWHWSISGLLIASVMFVLTWMGRSFGVSTTFKGACSAVGAGKLTDFFKMDLKDEMWRFTFVIGGLIGGVIGATFLRSPEAVDISQATMDSLAGYGLAYPEADANGMGFVPTDLLNFTSIKGVLLAIGGGFLVGFGARYGDGCTSGHAISGLSHLQLPSLITVIGFFIGGLLMTHLLLPLIFNL